MAKIFYTERDIEDMAQRGVTTIEVDDNVVLTDLAREMTFKYNIRLVPVKKTHPEDLDEAALTHRVKAAILARLGNAAIDMALLDAVIAKVVREYSQRDLVGR